MAQNEHMKQFLTLLVAMCVMIAPVVTNAGASVDESFAHTQDHKADCHTVAASDCDASHDGALHSNAKVSHGCCLSFVGIVPDTNLLQSAQGSNGFIPFNPSLSLAARIEGLYRPPRQLS
jgi:hypothetical protein